MNKVILMGRLTRDPEVRYGGADNQMAIANMMIAVDRRVKAGETDFFPLKAFGKLGEFAEKYLKQGTKIVVCGKIQTDNYTNKEGQKVYATNVIADEIEFAESKGSGSQTAVAQPQATQPQAAAEAAEPAQAEPSFDAMGITMEDVPYN